MAIGDIFQLTVQGLFLGQVTNNVFYYRQTTGTLVTDAAASLNERFNAEVRPQWLDCVSDDWSWQKNICFNLNNLAQFDEASYVGVVGTRTGDNSNAFLAWGFRMERTAIGQRYGYKRLAGVAETDVANGVATAGQITRLNALAADFALSLSDVDGRSWSPVVVERPIVYGVNPVWRAVTQVTYRGVTTQNSRK